MAPTSDLQRGAAALPDPMLPRLARIQRVRRETYDTFTLELEPPDRSGTFPFAPGQFNMLYALGIGEVPISISGDPAQPERLVHTIRAVGAVTRALWAVKPGIAVGVRGPFGTSWPVEAAVGSDVVVITGGIGLAPLRPALYDLLAHRERYGRIVLIYGARTPDDLLYPRELERWRSRFDLDIAVTVDAAGSHWRGNVGVVTTLIPRAPFDPAHTVAMICGPEIMMRFTMLELEKRGVAAENVYLSLERNMKCAVGFCGHCQLGPTFLCKNGPVFRYDDIRDWFSRREI
jgi:NAD(P)H-flavin reductase